ncbi:hypothetical protein TNCV_995601 [Trichonephila clavipes]|nr:hypothetical protein TNCV_995601 [Trichonephila clavipes]
MNPRGVIYMKTRLRTPSTDHHIVRNARAQPTASLAAIQAQVAPLLAAPVSTQPYKGAWLKDIWDRGVHYACCLEAHPSTPPFGVVLRKRKLYCREGESGHL